jgi:hypothetical protein
MKPSSELFTIELRLLDRCSHPDPNLEVSQLQAHSNIGAIEPLLPDRNESNVFTGQEVMK